MNQSARAKKRGEEDGSLSKSERQMMQGLYTQGGAAYGSLRNLVKASNLSVSKVGQFLHSKPSYKEFTLATRKFKRIKHLLDSNVKIGVWTWHNTLMNKPKIIKV